MNTKRGHYIAAGWLLSSATNSLIQDCYGKEKWVQMAQKDWIDWRISVPWAIAAIIIALFLVRTANKEGTRNHGWFRHSHN